MSVLSWREAAREAPDREALRVDDIVWSFSTLAARVTAAAAELHRRGVSPGQRVSLKAANGLATLVASLAVIEAGATLVPLHPRLTPAEDAVVLADATPVLSLNETDAQALLEAPAASDCTEVPYDPDVAAMVMYTSGTSGRPKGVVLSRRAFVAAATASAGRLGWGDDERWLVCLPLCHIGGFSILTRCLLGRGTVVLATGGFQADRVLALIARHRPTLLSVVPTMLHTLLERDGDNVLASLRAVLVGGAAAPSSLLTTCAERRVPALTTYGLTEACSQVTTQEPRDPGRTEPGSGRPLPGVEVRLVGDDGQPVAPGEVGTIQVRGPALMDGYLHAPPAPAGLATPAPWFDTGDLGSWTADGCLAVHARRSDLIVTGGENVSPFEVEQALTSLDGVEAAMVFAVPDPVWGQRVAAALVARHPLDEGALWQRLTTTLASHKLPRLVCLTDALPVGSTGKPLRREALARFGAALRPWVT